MNIKYRKLSGRSSLAAIRSRLAALAGVVTLLVAVLTGTAAGAASAAPLAAPVAATTHASAGAQPAVGGWVCPGTPIPPGYVVVGRSPSGCNGAGAWDLQPVHDGI